MPWKVENITRIVCRPFKSNVFRPFRANDCNSPEGA